MSITNNSPLGLPLEYLNNLTFNYSCWLHSGEFILQLRRINKKYDKRLPLMC